MERAIIVQSRLSAPKRIDLEEHKARAMGANGRHTRLERKWSDGRGISTSIVLATFISMSCAATEPAVEAVTYCQEGGDLWIGYQACEGMDWDYEPGSEIFSAVGHRFFAIDSSCTYYAFDGTVGDEQYYELADVRTGTLSENEARQFATWLELSSWSDHFGNRYGGGVDCGGESLFNLHGAFHCDCGCQGEPGAIAQTAFGIAANLVDRGRSMDGPLRVVTRKYPMGC